MIVTVEVNRGSLRRRFDRAAFDTALRCRGLTLAQLLEAASVPRHAWGELFDGPAPGPWRRAAIARVLDTGVDELWPLLEAAE
jgi:lambda repressor-like predicted transcriptional regulator